MEYISKKINYKLQIWKKNIKKIKLKTKFAVNRYEKTYKQRISFTIVDYKTQYDHPVFLQRYLPEVPKLFMVQPILEIF